MEDEPQNMERNEEGTSREEHEGYNSETSSNDANYQPSQEITPVAHSTPRSGRGRGRGRKPSSPPITPISDPCEGEIVWAKVKNSRWWPAVVVNRDDCGKLATVSGKRSFFFVFWFGDGRVSPVAKSKLVNFREGYKRFVLPFGSRNFRHGIYLAITEIRKLQRLEMEGWNESMAQTWAEEGFPLPDDSFIVRTHGFLSHNVKEKLEGLVSKFRSLNDEDDGGVDENVDDSDDLLPKVLSPEMDSFNMVRDGHLSLEELCFACVTKGLNFPEHPIFHASICSECLEKFLKYTFSIGLDDVAYYCCICLKAGNLIICSKRGCFRAYCSTCIEMKATLGVIDNIRDLERWECFVCLPYTPEMHGLIKPREAVWKKKVWEVFHQNLPTVKDLQCSALRILCCDGSCKTVLIVISILGELQVEIDTLYLCNFDSQDVRKISEILPSAVKILPSVALLQNYKTLAEIVPLDVVVCASLGADIHATYEKFINFHEIMNMVNVLNPLCAQRMRNRSVPLLWVVELSPQFDGSLSSIVSRYLELEPASWCKDAHNTQTQSCNLVWTNIPALWQSLEGDGLPLIGSSPTFTHAAYLTKYDKNVASADFSNEPEADEELGCDSSSSKMGTSTALKRKHRKKWFPPSTRITRSMLSTKS